MWRTSSSNTLSGWPVDSSGSRASAGLPRVAKSRYPRRCRAPSEGMSEGKWPGWMEVTISIRRVARVIATLSRRHRVVVSGPIWRVNLPFSSGP